MIVLVRLFLRTFLRPLSRGAQKISSETDLNETLCTHDRDDAHLSKAGIPIDVGIVQDLLTQPFPPMSSITKI